MVFDKERLVRQIDYGDRPALVPPGKTLQAVLLFDPVATGVKDEDRRLADSVVSGLQITAEDERRDQFDSTDLLPPGFSEGGRFLNHTVGGSHSDVGDTYVLNGLGTRSFNAGVDYLNALSDRPFLHKRALPEDPSHHVVHRSDQHLWGLYTTFGYRDDGIRDRHRDLAPQALCGRGAAGDCRSKDPMDPALDAGLQRRGAALGAVPAAPEPWARDGLGPTSAGRAAPATSFLDGVLDRLSRGAAERDDIAMRSAAADYMASPFGRAFGGEAAQRLQRLEAQERQLVSEAQQGDLHQAEARRVRLSP